MNYKQQPRLLEIPGVDADKMVMPPQDASLGEVAHALQEAGVDDPTDLLVSPSDIRLQLPVRELAPDEVRHPVVQLAAKVLMLVAGQEPGDTVLKDGTRKTLPRLVGLSDVQVWTPRPHLDETASDEDAALWGPVQLSLIPDPQFPVERGIQPKLIPVVNLRVTERSPERVWSFEGCGSVTPGVDVDKFYGQLEHPKWSIFDYLDLEGGERRGIAEDDSHVGPVEHEAFHNQGVRFGELVPDKRLYRVPADRLDLLGELRSMPHVSSVAPPPLNLPPLDRGDYEKQTATGRFADKAEDREAAYRSILRTSG